RGGAAAIIVNIARKAPFAGPVTLTLSGLPAGLTAPPVVVAPAAAQGVLAVAIPAETQVGTLAGLQVTGTGDAGGKPFTATAGPVAIAVEEPFAAALAAPAVTVKEGAAGDLVVS